MESTLIKGLQEHYDLSYSKEDLRKNKIIPSYFYLVGQTSDDKRVDFIHKSFREHLLAE